MASEASRPTGTSGPIVWLTRSRSIRVLWMVRMLVKLNACSNLCDIRNSGARDSVARRLHLPDLVHKDDAPLEAVHQRLSLSLDRMERNAKKFRCGKVLEANLALLGRQFALTNAEQTVLALAVLLRADEDLHQVAVFAKGQVNVAVQISRILGLSSTVVGEILSPGSRLRRSGLIEVQSGQSPDHNLQLRRGGLRKLASARITSIDDLFGAFLHASPLATLSQEDFAHLRPNLDFVTSLVREAIDSKRSGVNVLLYGPPGTGKTELARTLASELRAPLFEVSSVDEGGAPIDPRARLAGSATAQCMLSGRRALLVFDEIDSIFNDGSDFFGKPTTAESSKAWVNNLLEQNQIPTIWIANRIWNMDPAFIRRFDLVIKLDPPPMRQRLQLLERQCGGFLDDHQMQRLARVGTITPAILARAASVVRRLEVDLPRSQALEAVLDGTLQGQGHPTVRRSCRGAPPAGYDISLCNASEDLSLLAEGLARSQAGRICLYGPPGTGKTAFGYWLASTLDKPLLLKRTSDVQSPFVGEMERKLAKVFEEAARDQAVLQIDEVDSFLRDRRDARHIWEVSQVNEFLTQLESFDGIFIASTNLMDGLDQAALRRFDYKIQVTYLRPEQSWQMLNRQIDDWKLPMTNADWCRRELANMTLLTPGDFAVVARRHALCPYQACQAVVAALRSEIRAKSPAGRRIGFI